MENEQTLLLRQQAEKCESLSELSALLSDDNAFMDWGALIRRLLDESGLSYTAFSKRCGLSKTTVAAWCREGGLPRSRDTVLKVAFGAGMDPDGCDRLLSRFGGYPGLNPRDPFDAACIFCLGRRAAGDLSFDFSAAAALYDRWLPGERDSGRDESTTLLRGQLLQIDTESEFQRFLQDSGAALTGRRPKFEAFLSDFLTMRRLELRRQEDGDSLRAMELPPALQQQISLLNTQGRIPRRGALLAIGLRLGMTMEELDHLLTSAGMEPLCPRDRLECVVIYALQVLTATHPELALGNATALLAVTRSPQTRERCAQLAEEYFSACYRSSEDDVDSVSGYVRRILEQLDLSEAETLLGLLR